MSRVICMRQPTGLRFPRVSGDEPRGEIVHVETGVFSPRERG